MDKRKKRTEKPGRVVVQVVESQEITFEQFERTVRKVVRAKPPKSEPLKDSKGGSRNPRP